MAYDIRTDPCFSDDIVPEAPRLITDYMLNLFDHPDRWTQHASARRVDGSPTQPLRADATCFCLQGGLERARNALKLSFHDLNRTWIMFDRVTHGTAAFNDSPSTTFDDVLSVIRMVRDDTDHG